MAFEYLATYKTFESIADMDKSVEDHIAAHYYDLTESERAIVIALSQRSLMYPGASHLKAETIAEATGTSRSTVMRAIKKLVELNIIEKVKQTKLNGIKGASIYKILPYSDTSEMKHREAVDEASNDVVCRPQIKNLSLNSFNLLSSKQANNIMSLENELALQAEKKKEYMNEYQVMLFDFMNSLPLADNLKGELHKCVLASQVNTVEDFIKAKNVLFKIAIDIKEGVLTVTSTLRAVFVGAFNKAVECLDNKSDKSSSIEETPSKERPVPFYNWLKERDCPPQSNNNRPCNLENWLEW
ncbi:helix-turn-helix domain-containing protein [Lysinibacillus sphaericus]|uniref:Helix-turn-helix domain-containing protein n=1 Tax=Lysinibacillus sphaericus TaxID=1421 RepID=A0A544U7G2_LYSSH|nr:helix-turn-helix domain-containing protein [Lysinibacillus sp. SDF0037]TQR26958.1 helix-turn-helix domain-containing protein [Lysinibacillus sp. SDF0037]